MKPRAMQYPLRLPRSLKANARLMAERDGVSLNQFICVAVAEKVQRVEEEEGASAKAAMLPESHRSHAPPKAAGVVFASGR
jgi:HicB family